MSVPDIHSTHPPHNRYDGGLLPQTLLFLPSAQFTNNAQPWDFRDPTTPTFMADNMKYKNSIPTPMFIIQHRNEDRKKCTLNRIRDHDAFTFAQEGDLTISPDSILLHSGGEALTSRDKGRPLILVDGIWRDFTKMLNRDPELMKIERRRIDGFITVFPRKGRNGPHPQDHLASIEVIIATGLILGISAYQNVLDSYHFKNEFIRLNHDVIKKTHGIDPTTLLSATQWGPDQADIYRTT
jgi:ribosome biogenesis protein Tsr3